MAFCPVRCNIPGHARTLVRLVQQPSALGRGEALLAPRDAAALLGVTADTVRRWVSDGRLAADGLVSAAMVVGVEPAVKSGGAFAA